MHVRNIEQCAHYEVFSANTGIGTLFIHFRFPNTVVLLNLRQTQKISILANDTGLSSDMQGHVCIS